MQRLRIVPLLGLLAVACAKPRPATALDYCRQVAKHFDGKVECIASLSTRNLLAMKALEGALLVQEIPDARDPNVSRTAPVAYVAYHENGEAPRPSVVAPIVSDTSWSAVSLVHVSNLKARVSVYVVRGKLAAAQFEALQTDVERLAPR